MDKLGSSDTPQDMESQKAEIITGIAALFERGDLADEVDREVVARAGSFVENPTEVLSEIMDHTKMVAYVISDYEMEGLEAPDEVNALYGYIFSLQCISLIKLIEVELSKEHPDTSMIQKDISRGSAWSKRLLKEYNDDTFLNAFAELQERI